MATEPNSRRGTPFVETEILLAALDSDEEHFAELIAGLLPMEAQSLAKAARWIYGACLDHVQVAERADRPPKED